MSDWKIEQNHGKTGEDCLIVADGSPIALVNGCGDAEKNFINAKKIITAVKYHEKLIEAVNIAIGIAKTHFHDTPTAQSNSLKFR